MWPGCMSSSGVDAWVKKRTLWELFSMTTALVMLLAYVLYWYSQQPGTRHYWCWLFLVATWELGPKIVRAIVEAIRK